MSRWLGSFGAISLAVAIGCGEAAFAADKGWTPLVPDALTRLYAGKTWRWKQGAAYFAPDGRFKAWSGSKRNPTEGIGTWDVRDEGVMCFVATWTTIGKPSPNPNPPVETCFRHQAKRGMIAQAKVPGAQWYVFKHALPRQSDEFFKLRVGDHTRLKSTPPS
jgi:hypothetical protein